MSIVKFDNVTRIYTSMSLFVIWTNHTLKNEFKKTLLWVIAFQNAMALFL